MDPDKVIVTSNYKFNFLDKIYKKIQLINLSKKKNEKQFESLINNSLKQKNITILILPEAFFDECYVLLNFAITCAKKFSNLKFICRFHPITDKYWYNRVLSNISEESVAFQNISEICYLNEKHFRTRKLSIPI